MPEYNLGRVKGTDGNGIKDITKTETVGLNDIYTITMDDDTEYTFVVTNGEDGSAGDIDDNVTQNSANPVKSSGIYNALTGKANTTHTHSISDVTNLQTALDGKASSTHNHSISDVTNLQSSLNAKANSSDLGAVATSNDYDDLDNIPSSFTPSSHTHAISEVTNLQTNLNGKVNTSDIVDNLTTNDATKVLSAKQGKVLNDLIGTAITYINQ